MSPDHKDFRTVKKIIVIARRHFRTGKNVMPALKAKNPHYGKWECPHSAHKLTVKFDDTHAQVIFSTGMRNHLFLTDLSMIEHRLDEKISITRTNFSLHTQLIAFREKIKHLIPKHTPPEVIDWVENHTLRR